MYFEQYFISGLGCASYLVGDEGTAVAAVIDPDRDVRKYLDTAAAYTRERPGMSAFVLDDGVVYHTYSTFSRGLDGLWSMFQWLDRAPLGRNQQGIWWRRNDEYAPGP